MPSLRQEARECRIGASAMANQRRLKRHESAKFRQEALHCAPVSRVEGDLGDPLAGEARQSSSSACDAAAIIAIRISSSRSTTSRFLRLITRVRMRSSSANSVPRLTAATMASPPIRPNTLPSSSPLSTEYRTLRRAAAASSDCPSGTSNNRAVFTNPAKELVSRCSASSAAVTAFSTSSGTGRLGRSEPSSGPGNSGNGQRTARASLESCPSSSSPNGPDATLSLFRSAALPRRPMNSARS